MQSKWSKNYHQKRSPQHQRSSVEVDVESLLLLENRGNGCARGERCCCSSYEVCVTTAEMKRIIRVLPEAAKFSPRLLTTRGYDSVFELEEPNLFSIDTDDDGLCLFAYWTHGRVQSSVAGVWQNLAAKGCRDISYHVNLIDCSLSK